MTRTTVRPRALIGLAAAAVFAAAGCADDGVVSPDVAVVAAAADVSTLTGPQGNAGQFVVECAYSHSNLDDPIVHPGHAGMSHRHDFFGNTTTDATSTYESLLAGDTTCNQRLDTAAYWTPSLLDADGDAVEPTTSIAYYRAGTGVDPATVVAYPAGLMMLAGDPAADEPQGVEVIAWGCAAGGRRAAAPPSCPDGRGLHLAITFPDCWNGVDLDSDDHRSHVAYSAGDGDGDHGCPDDHPVAIPQLQFVVGYPPLGDDPEELSLSSGSIHSAHADFWNAWDQDRLEREVAVCVVADRVCSIASYAGLAAAAIAGSDHSSECNSSDSLGLCSSDSMPS